MKTVSITILLIALFSIPFFAQSNWYAQNSGTNAILQDIFFVDQDYGWIAGAHIILHTTDGGTTWVEQPAPPVQIYYVDIFFLDRMNGWACGNEAKIIHTTDGGNTWVEQPNPYTFPNPILYSIYFANPDTGWAFGGDHGNYPTFTNHRVILYTTNGGNTWDFQYNVPDEKPLFAAHFISSTAAFAAAEWGDIMYTSNGGNSWLAKTSISSYELYGIYFANSTTGWVAGEYLGVPHVSSISKTTDGGNSWNTQTFGTDEYLEDIYFVDDMTGWAVGGTIGGSGGTQHTTILHTTDGGESWALQNTPSTSTLLGISFVNEGYGWAVGVDGVVLAYENTVPVELTSFTASVNNKNMNIRWRTASEKNNSGFEILRSIQNEDNWNQIGFVEGHGTTTEENDYSFVDKDLESGNYSYKLVQVDFGGTQTESEIINVEVNSQPEEYSLSQNYPNPFNPTTTIEFSIPQSENVKLIVFNSLGEEVATLVNEFKESGKHEIDFKEIDIPSGVYYYKIIAGSFAETKKMILLK